MGRPPKADPWNKARTRAITITNYGDKWTELQDGVQYLAWSEETCPTTQRKHLQAFAYSHLAQRFAWWNKRFPSMHIEIMRGTFADNETYCSKENNLEELGTRPMLNGENRAKHVLVQLMHEGMHPMDIAESRGELYETVARYDHFNHKMWDHIQTKKMEERGFHKKQVFILMGKSDKGKTRSVLDEHGYSNVYRAVSNKGQWFDGYRGQPVALFNDVGPGDIMPITQFLNLCDGYPLSVPVKGGFTPWTPDIIYFTTNVDYRHWWSDPNQEHLLAAKRRVTEVRVFKDDGTIVFE